VQRAADLDIQLAVELPPVHGHRHLIAAIGSLAEGLFDRGLGGLQGLRARRALDRQIVQLWNAGDELLLFVVVGDGHAESVADHDPLLHDSRSGNAPAPGAPL
jgi:hypothetical protein